MTDFEERRAKLKERAEHGGVIEKAQLELFEYETRPRTVKADVIHAQYLADTVRELLKRRYTTYSEGYADGYADGQAGNPPYVEPTTIEERPDYEYHLLPEGHDAEEFAHEAGTSREEALRQKPFVEGAIGSPYVLVYRTKAGPWQVAP